jgi:putative oxidoreductase
MNTAHLETVWAPRLLSILRIVAALIFMAHGTQKLLGFPASPNPCPGSPACLNLSAVRC